MGWAERLNPKSRYNLERRASRPVEKADLEPVKADECIAMFEEKVPFWKRWWRRLYGTV